VLIALAGRPDLRGTKINIPGPELVEARTFYEEIARGLGTTVRVEDAELTTDHTCEEQYARHRILAADALRESGLPVPRTSIRDGLARTLSRMQSGSATADGRA
jgi:nucleoside-diphosphate-sugar epimerase